LKKQHQGKELFINRFQHGFEVQLKHDSQGDHWNKKNPESALQMHDNTDKQHSRYVEEVWPTQ
jgi:hypothetical protein